MGLVFGFRDDEMVTPQEQGVEVDESFTVEPGQTHTDGNGNTYTATGRDEK
ncbi:hypothetical protein AB0I16_03750 [Streptomyces sp. NPDC050703]|uniref:hypothetical protein n=1 Tax=Streptomyces sp. NPDC050703 TaxID=3157218 RepID=UPI0034421257